MKCRYFSELSRYQVEKLTELYHLDLLLFGYSTQVQKGKLKKGKLKKGKLKKERFNYEKLTNENLIKESHPGNSLAVILRNSLM